jgi:hypothetical protein
MPAFMADASDLPILLDGDTGYRNFNKMRGGLEQRDIAGVCIEDKQFRKTNSFLHGDRQPLADVPLPVQRGAPITLILRDSRGCKIGGTRHSLRPCKRFMRRWQHYANSPSKAGGRRATGAMGTWESGCAQV